MTSPAGNGIVSIRSAHPVEETVQRLNDLLAQKGITLFALIDHSAEAEKIGLKMAPTKLLIFGNPAAGTPLMLAAPSTAIDLPLKLLVAEQPDSSVLISWNDPAFLRARHGFPVELEKNIAAVAKLAEAVG